MVAPAERFGPRARREELTEAVKESAAAISDYLSRSSGAAGVLTDRGIGGKIDDRRTSGIAIPIDGIVEIQRRRQDGRRPGSERQVGRKTLVRDISFCGVPENGSNASMVDVKDGKIIRIRPMHYDWKYDPEKHMNPWKMEVRGSTFEPSMKTLIPPYSIAYKKRVYSPARVRYPMKRVDWDPNGERNPQNRGKSKYVRISWDEALDIVTAR